MATLQDVQAAIAAYQQTDTDIAAQQVVVSAAALVLEQVTAAGLAAVDAAAADTAAAQASFDAAYEAINAIVQQQNQALGAVITAVAAYVP